MANNAAMIQYVVERDLGSPVSKPTPRSRVILEPCLPARLPSTAFLQREAEHAVPIAFSRQLRGNRTSTSSPTSAFQSESEEQDGGTRRMSISSATSPSSPSSPSAKFVTPQSRTSKTWKEPQPFEIFRAIERKDIMFLMEVRDHAFQLLLRKTGDATPLLHAMRIGQSHRDVAILLLGAFSRWINHLEDSEMQLPKTRIILKALRINLKLAIDYGLYKSQSDLIASFLQTLVMSEGDKWVRAQIHTVSIALRSGSAGKPVSTAEAAVRKFATRELSRADAIAALEDYIANATVDLLLLSTWSMALDSITGEPIPVADSSTISREMTEFSERSQIAWSYTRTRYIVTQVLDDRHVTYRAKVEVLTSELDESDGV
ncbi:hypothetical protein PISMIDRAFT_20766 [Pisolithus microcarpus 441]|uniref:Uncharacterized protein n=1 Tax=Pisolithus microcarpus 441 TaxID=765257 RepID=A0A0C9ZX25_9AGAM|nr:hypothetical protein PISMIDRAFT_20766 [Pisolithus microcarpus 441]